MPVADGVRCWPRLPSLPLPTAELPPAPVFVPLPVPTTEPLLVPTAVPLPAPTAVPVPALTVVPLLVPTAVPFPAHADCRTISGADGHAGAGSDCRHFQYQQPRCLLRRCSCHFQSHGACPDSRVTSSANSCARPRVGLFLLWRLRRSSCSGRFGGVPSPCRRPGRYSRRLWCCPPCRLPYHFRLRWPCRCLPRRPCPTRHFSPIQTPSRPLPPLSSPAFLVLGPF